MTQFDTLIHTARRFYAELNKNNKKDWWTENRGPYDEVLKPGAEALLADLSVPLAELAGTPIKTKLFRPHRDVRFSKDKTPYNTHLHMMWQTASDARQNPVFFFGIGLDYVTAGAGIMAFDKPVLENWRTFVDLDTKRITGILDGLTAKGFRLREPALKRVPPAYAKDHPAGELLRMKGVTASRELPDETTDLPTTLQAVFTDLWPLNALLIQIGES